MTLLESKPTAIVTGGASGLGAATVAALRDQGATVVVFDLPGAIDRLHRAGVVDGGVTYLPVDVTDSEQVIAAVGRAAELGELRIVVTCAGVCPSMRIVGRTGPHSPELFANTMKINVMGTFNVLTEAAGHMAQLEPSDTGERGVIVMAASVAAFEGQVGQAAYAASKGAIHSLTLTAARDLGSLGIRVNSVAPGVVETPMMAGINEAYRRELEANVVFPKRLAHPEEFAQLVEAIASNPYLNGETIRLDGALRMPPR